MYNSLNLNSCISELPTSRYYLQLFHTVQFELKSKLIKYFNLSASDKIYPALFSNF